MSVVICEFFLRRHEIPQSIISISSFFLCMIWWFHLEKEFH